MAFSTALSIREPSVDETRQRHRPHQSLSRIAKSFHSSTPSLPPKHRAGDEMISRRTLDRKIRELAPIHRMDRHQFGELFKSALEREFEAKSYKEIANEVGDGTTESTVKTWREGISQPGFFKGLRLAAATPSLAKEVVRLIALEANHDPEFQRDLMEFMQKWSSK